MPQLLNYLGYTLGLMWGGLLDNFFQCLFNVCLLQVTFQEIVVSMGGGHCGGIFCCCHFQTNPMSLDLKDVVSSMFPSLPLILTPEAILDPPSGLE